MATDELVFARQGDLPLLGARTLEDLNLRGDSRAKKLVAGVLNRPRRQSKVWVTTLASWARIGGRNPSDMA